jgi:uncharacterized sporulation protein YeaH/YhbH (DUF444 family)
MEKGQESKQKRKTPLTTIAISQEYAQKLDEYLNGTGITRKEFVELSVDYFQRTGFDLRGEAFDLSPLKKSSSSLFCWQDVCTNKMMITKKYIDCFFIVLSIGLITTQFLHVFFRKFFVRHVPDTVLDVPFSYILAKQSSQSVTG